MESPDLGPNEADLHWMQTALVLAREAAAHGDVPVGAVLVSAEGQLVATAKNERELRKDPTAHAEVLAVRAAAAARGHWRLDDLTLYVTLEPCPMCAGALVLARIARVVYGCHDPKGGAVVSKYTVGQDERLNHRFALTNGVLEAQCADELRAFFRALRASGKNGRYKGG